MSGDWTAADLPDLSGTTAVITGASSGIGLETAIRLAGAGARVVLAVRNLEKGRSLAQAMTGQVEARELDLASLASIRAFAGAWSDDLHLLVNNAGIMMVPEGRTEDGFELQMGTNHLGHFALTMLLLPYVTHRVVTLSSELHSGGRINLGDLAIGKEPYDPLQAYRDSKLANLLFTHELSRRLHAVGSSVQATAAHPGLAKTNLTGHLGGPVGLIQRMMVRLFNDVEHGALPTLYAATQDIPSGSYVGPDGFRHLRGHPVVHDPAAAAADPSVSGPLWQQSAQLTGTVEEAAALPAHDTQDRTGT